jgi:hypothetical protein
MARHIENPPLQRVIKANIILRCLPMVIVKLFISVWSIECTVVRIECKFYTILQRRFVSVIEAWVYCVHQNNKIYQGALLCFQPSYFNIYFDVLPQVRFLGQAIPYCS